FLSQIDLYFVPFGRELTLGLHERRHAERFIIWDRYGQRRGPVALVQDFVDREEPGRAARVECRSCTACGNDRTLLRARKTFVCKAFVGKACANISHADDRGDREEPYEKKSTCRTQRETTCIHSRAPYPARPRLSTCLSIYTWRGRSTKYDGARRREFRIKRY